MMVTVVSELFGTFPFDSWKDLTPFIVLFSSILAATLALWAILANRSTAKKRASIDFIFETGRDVILRDAFRTIVKIHDDPNLDIQKLAYVNNNPNPDNADDIRTILNFFENMSVAIHNGAFEDKLIREAWYGIVTRLYDMCEDFITESSKQTNSKTQYQDFKKLSERW